MRSILRRSTNRTRFFRRGFLFVTVLVANGFYQPTNAQTSPTSTASQADNDAAAKAAARKKRFEEAKKALENQDSPESRAKAQNPPSSGSSTAKPAQQVNAKTVFNIEVTMAVGESQSFYLYEEQHGNVTTEAQWKLNEVLGAADLSLAGGVPTVTAKNTGVVSLYGVLGERSAFASINIVTKEQIAKMTRWDQASLQRSASLKIVPAIPTMGPRR